MAKLLLILASLAFCNAEMGRQRRWRMERRKKAAAAAAAARREREKNAPRDAESTSDGAIANWRQRARASSRRRPARTRRSRCTRRTSPGPRAASGRRRRGDGVSFTDFYARRTPSTRHPRRRWRLPVGTPIAAQNRRSDGVRRPRAQVRLHRAQGPGHGRDHVPLAQGPRQGPERRVVGRADGGVSNVCVY